MKLTHARIVNYKCFSQPEEFSIGPNFNAVVGRNDVGKSCLLQALSLHFANAPHRGFRATSLAEGSFVEIEFAVTQAELAALLQHEIKGFQLPCSAEFEGGSIEDHAWSIYAAVVSAGDLQVRCRIHGRAGVSIQAISPDGLGRYRENPDRRIQFGRGPENRWRIVPGQKPNRDNVLSKHLASALRRRTYLFSPLRTCPARSAFGDDSKLHPDGQNLPIVLNRLQANSVAFSRYMSVVRQVFPSIDRVSVPPATASELEIRIWKHPDADREEHAYSLVTWIADF